MHIVQLVKLQYIVRYTMKLLKTKTSPEVAHVGCTGCANEIS